jgi:hypothetical protein
MYAALLAAPVPSPRPTGPTRPCWVGLLTLTALEIVLGIDNVIFLSILAGRLRPSSSARPPASGSAGGVHHAHRACLFSLSWLVRSRRRCSRWARCGSSRPRRARSRGAT